LIDSNAAAKAWPLSSEGVRLCWLRSICEVAEGADVPLSHADADADTDAASACVAAVLGDALARVSVLGGRDGLPRSLGSVHGGSVTRFLGGSLRGVVSRVIDTPGVRSYCNGVAVSRDGTTLLVSDGDGRSESIHEFSVADGSRRRVVGGAGHEQLRFNGPRQVCIAPDGFVFVADRNNDRVQVLTPRLHWHAFIGVGELRSPRGVCANADIVVVAEVEVGCMLVFNRSDGAVLRRFGSQGSGDGQLRNAAGLCFMSCGRRRAELSPWRRVLHL
jgi:DNA-binding beta-propeller fold protein YncE